MDGKNGAAGEDLRWSSWLRPLLCSRSQLPLLREGYLSKQIVADKHCCVCNFSHLWSNCVSMNSLGNRNWKWEVTSICQFAGLCIVYVPSVYRFRIKKRAVDAIPPGMPKLFHTLTAYLEEGRDQVISFWCFGSPPHHSADAVEVCWRVCWPNICTHRCLIDFFAAVGGETPFSVRATFVLRLWSFLTRPMSCFLNLTFTYSSVRKLVKLSAVQFMLNNHTVSCQVFLSILIWWCCLPNTVSRGSPLKDSSFQTMTQK